MVAVNMGAAGSAAMTGLLLPLGHFASPVTTIWVRSGEWCGQTPPTNLLSSKESSMSQGQPAKGCAGPSATPAPRARARACTHLASDIIHLNKEFV